MTSLARAIVRLYPRAWRDRYGPELLDLIASRRLRMSDIGDLGRGALDAACIRSPRPARPCRWRAGPPWSLRRRPSWRRFRRRPARESYGPVVGTPGAVIGRRRFLRRMVGAGIGLLSLEFIGGTIAFLWPPPADGVGVEHEVGTLDDIAGLWPAWPDGMPYEFRPARAFLVNVPAATAMALGETPTATATSAVDLLALWRKCPHLGCMIPAACEERGRFQCLCHQSTYNIIGEKLRLGPAPRGMDRFPSASRPPEWSSSTRGRSSPEHRREPSPSPMLIRSARDAHDRLARRAGAPRRAGAGHPRGAGDGPKHGYAIMSESEAISGTPMGPGTLYAALARLESRGLVEALPAEDRRPVPAHGGRGAGGTRASRSAGRPRAGRARALDGLAEG